LRAEAAEAVLNQRDGVFEGLLLQGGRGFDFLDGDVVGREGRQRFSRVGELHDVAILGFEIDNQAFVRAVPILDFAEAPTAVKAVSARGEQLELFRQSG